jgi:hypothetical protein
MLNLILTPIDVFGPNLLTPNGRADFHVTSNGINDIHLGALYFWKFHEISLFLSESWLK